MDPGPLRVLYADDDPNDLALFGIAVDQMDIDLWLYTARDLEEVADYLEGKGVYADRHLHPLPDLLMLDLRLPGTTGLEFLDWRKTYGFSSIPTVVFSAAAQARQTALNLGADLFVEKPPSFEQLKAVVKRIYDFGSIRRQPAV